MPRGNPEAKFMIGPRSAAVIALGSLAAVMWFAGCSQDFFQGFQDGRYLPHPAPATAAARPTQAAPAPATIHAAAPNASHTAAPTARASTAAARTSAPSTSAAPPAPANPGGLKCTGVDETWHSGIYLSPVTDGGQIPSGAHVEATDITFSNSGLNQDVATSNPNEFEVYVGDRGELISAHLRIIAGNTTITCPDYRG